MPSQQGFWNHGWRNRALHIVAELAGNVGIPLRRPCCVIAPGRKQLRRRKLG